MSDALARCSILVHSSLETGGILSSVIAEAARAVDADMAVVVMREDGHWRMAGGYQLPFDGVGKTFSDDDLPLSTECFRRAEVVIDLNYAEHEHALFAQEATGIESAASVPVAVKDDVVGVMSFMRRHREPFTEEQLQFARHLSLEISLASQNARLYEEQRLRTALADALNDVDCDVDRTLDFEGALCIALPRAAQALCVDAAAVALVHKGGWLLRKDLTVPPIEDDIPFEREALHTALAALEGGRVLDVSDLLETPDAEIAARFGVRAALAVPLSRADVTFGVAFFAQLDTPRHWRRHEVDFAAQLGYHLSLAAQNSALFAAERTRASLSAQLNDINAVIHSSLQFEEVVAEALARGAAAVGADAASLAIRENGRWVTRYEHRLGKDLLGYSFGDEDIPFVERLRLFRMPLVWDHTETTRRSPKRRGPAFHADLVTPLFARNDVLGLMSFHLAEPSARFTPDAVDFARKLGSSVSLALGNLQLYQDEQRSVRLSEALTAVNELLLSTLDVEEMLERIVWQASDAAGADKALLAKPDGDEWVVASTHGFAEGLAGTRFPREAMPCWAETARTRKPMLIHDARTDGRTNPRFAEEFEVHSAILFPLAVREGFLGVLMFGYEQAEALGAKEIKFAQRLSTAITLALQNARLYQNERHIAETLQETLLVMPKRIKGIELGRVYRSATDATRVAGDFVDAYQLSDRRVAIALGDVSGKGLEAASITAMVRNTFRAHAVDGLPPSEIATKTNNLLHMFTPTQMFVTGFLSVLDTRSGRMQYVSAGHPPALIVGRDGDVRALPTRGPVLGAFHDIEYRDGHCVLAPGECLVAYSDGVTEARNGTGMYGEERLMELAAGLAGEPPQRIADAIFSAIDAFAGRELRDDVAILAVSRQARDDSPGAQQRFDF